MAKDEAKKLNIAQEIMTRSTDYLRRIVAPAGRARRRYDVIFVPALKQFPVGRLRLVGLWVKKGVTIGGARFVEKSTIGSNQTGSYALELLANRQEDGDGFMQNIVTNLGEESREGLTHWLRESMEIDNHRALEVGYLNEGLGTFKVLIPRGVGQGEPR